MNVAFPHNLPAPNDHKVFMTELRCGFSDFPVHDNAVSSHQPTDIERAIPISHHLLRIHPYTLNILHIPKTHDQQDRLFLQISFTTILRKISSMHTDPNPKLHLSLCLACIAALSSFTVAAVVFGREKMIAASCILFDV
jgi:hypothetical protein